MAAHRRRAATSTAGARAPGPHETLNLSPRKAARRRNASAIPPRAAPDQASSRGAVGAGREYLLDVLERSVLFADVLRARGEQFLEHERLNLPALLRFRHEMVLDARTLAQPANYALLRIVEVDDACWEDCVDGSRPPVIVLDPRAGHGPGIGGFKRDSEVGMALQEGHPVYFVMFFPEPARGQTLADVHHALRRFVEEVHRRHPAHAPVLYGNCQAGWAAALLAADCEGVAGPVVLNGSPLSYWAGEAGVNPMRVAGGLLGGAWLAHLTADLGDGRFDGAWLAQNFESLKPEKALWEKHAALFHRVDTEAERFLEFERWWNGFYALSTEEILAIVENLFIGNRLERGEFRLCDGCSVDLRRMQNPLIVFASRGDNITPPQQALGWIPAVYQDTAELRRAGQRIVYLVNPHVGHLGIFVSAKVARFEHRAILESLPEIDALSPGLYEMRIENPTGDPDCHKPQYAVHFEPREVSDLGIEPEPGAFMRVRTLSEANELTYRTFVSPWTRMLATPWSAQALKWAHPMRVRCYSFSESLNPWMAGVRMLAEGIRRGRTPLAEEHPWMAREQQVIDGTTDAITAWRQWRDALYEKVFAALYGGFPARANSAGSSEQVEKLSERSSG